MIVWTRTVYQRRYDAWMKTEPKFPRGFKGFFIWWNQKSKDERDKIDWGE